MTGTKTQGLIRLQQSKNVNKKSNSLVRQSFYIFWGVRVNNKKETPKRMRKLLNSWKPFLYLRQSKITT